MLALAQLSPVSTIESKIQSRVATFLGLKEYLVKLTTNASPSIRSRAVALYTAQQIYEKQLQEALQKIENIKAGAYTFSDIISIGTFAYDMETHIGNVQTLQKEAGTTIDTGISMFPSMSPTLIAAGLGIVALYVIYKS